MVIAFELTILLGALSTVAAVALFSVLLGKRGMAYDPRFSDDQIGIFVPAGADQARRSSSCCAPPARWRCGMKRPDVSAAGASRRSLGAASLLAGGCDFWYYRDARRPTSSGTSSPGSTT